MRTRWLAAVVLIAVAVASPGAPWIGAGRADGQPKEFKVDIL